MKKLFVIEQRPNCGKCESYDGSDDRKQLEAAEFRRSGEISGRVRGVRVNFAQ